MPVVTLNATWATATDVLLQIGGVDLTRFATRLLANTGQTVSQLATYFLPSVKETIQAYCGFPIDEQRQTLVIDGNGKGVLPLGVRPVTAIYSVNIRGDAGALLKTYTQAEISVVNTVNQYGVQLATESIVTTPMFLILDVDKGKLSTPWTPREHGSAIPSLVSSISPFRFEPGKGNIEIDARYGYPASGGTTVAKDIIQAHAMMVAILILKQAGQVQSDGMAQWRVMGETADFRFGAMQREKTLEPELHGFVPDGPYGDMVAHLLSKTKQILSGYRSVALR